MKIDRLLSMILLMLKREKITAAEMAEYFETSPRTIYRDIETLCMAGIPVVSEPGVNGGYSLMEGFTLDRQVFKVDEILALIAGLKGLEKVFDSPSVRQTVEKVEHLAGRKRKDQIRNEQILEIDFFGWGEGSRLQNTVQRLFKSIGDNRCVSFEYTNLNNQNTRRTVEPMKLFYRGSNWYLMGYCRFRNDFRFFRVSRILNLKSSGDIFCPRENALPDWAPDTVISDRRPVQNLRLRISPGGAARAREYFSESAIAVERDGSLDIRVSYPPDEWVYSYLLGYGEHLTVLEPPELREELLRRSEVFLKNNRSLTHSCQGSRDRMGQNHLRSNNMEQKLGKCGIDCHECTAYKATVENSDDLRVKTAEEWSKMFGAQIDPKMINCMGCQNDKTLFSHCQVCGIRSCARDRGLETCADCPDYGCEKVSSIWAHDASIKENLDRLRA